MNKAAMALVVAAMVPAFASAADLTINFTGNITDQTCVINGGTSSSMTVAMPTVSTGNFKAAGDVAGTTPFEVNLTKCPGSVSQVSGLFEVGTNVNTSTGTLKIAAGTPSPAKGVEIQLLDASTNKIRADGGKTPTVDVTSGNATIRMYSQYIATGTEVKPGKTDTSVGFNISYN